VPNVRYGSEFSDGLGQSRPPCSGLVCLLPPGADIGPCPLAKRRHPATFVSPPSRQSVARRPVRRHPVSSRRWGAVLRDGTRAGASAVGTRRGTVSARPTSSSRRSASAMRLRAKSTSRTLTRTMSPGFLLGYPGRTVTGHVSGIGRGITVPDAATGGTACRKPRLHLGAASPACSRPNGDRRPAARRSAIGGHDGWFP
jgi:hypothetical protein